MTRCNLAQATRLLATLLLLCFLLPCGGCRKAPAPGGSAGKLTVVTTLFPLYDFVRTIGGDKVSATLLLPPGVESHSFEPKPDDIIRINSAAVFIYTSEQMERWALKLIRGLEKKTTVVEAGRGAHLLEGDAHDHDHGAQHGRETGNDPHVWLDFANAQIMVDNMAAGLATRDSGNREYYLARAAALKERLKALDDRFKNELSDCATRNLLHGGHYAFGYLAHRYNLNYRAAKAVNADAEPTPGRLAALVRQIRAEKLPYIFSEELVSPRTAEIIANESGASILMLHGAHNIGRDDLASGVTFFSLMEQNLSNLKTGLGCR